MKVIKSPPRDWIDRMRAVGATHYYESDEWELLAYRKNEGRWEYYLETHAAWLKVWFPRDGELIPFGDNDD
jgi:hypothetical protein